MDNPEPTRSQQIAQAASAFEHRLTGRVPRSVTVVLSENTLVITLHGALSPAEEALAKTPAGAAEVQEFHRQLFAASFDSLRQEIKRITGVEVREATAEVDGTTGTVVKAFTTGTVVQVFLLAGSVPRESWSESAASPTEQPNLQGISEVCDGSLTGASPRNVTDIVWQEVRPMTEKKKHVSSEHHYLAAAEYEAAAHHHRQAAHHHDQGCHEEARKHAVSAQDHSQDADRHSKTAHQHSQK